MMKRQRALGLRALSFGDLQLIFDVYFSQKEYPILSLLNVSFHLSFQRTSVGRDLTRLQRASKGAGHSRANGGDDMIDGGWKLFFDRRPVPGLDTPMHAGANGLR